MCYDDDNMKESRTCPTNHSQNDSACDKQSNTFILKRIIHTVNTINDRSIILMMIRFSQQLLRATDKSIIVRLRWNSQYQDRIQPFPVNLIAPTSRHPHSTTAVPSRNASTNNDSVDAATTIIPPLVRIVEVGPRDGLQNEPSNVVTTADKVEFVKLLYQAGCRHIEAGSFVSPKSVPAMADSEAVMAQLNAWRKQQQQQWQSDNNRNHHQLILSCLVPNLRGWQQAQTVHPNEIAIFASASEGFSQRNLQCSIAESMQRYQEVVQAMQPQQRDHPPTRLRGYVSCVMACPYDGPTAPSQVATVVEQLLRLGCHEISLGDTIGVGTVAHTRRLLQTILPLFDQGTNSSRSSTATGHASCAVHFHDTYGQALTNILTSLEYGITVVDASVAGLGGCPYAKGATGNVATEDVVYMLNGLGVTTGIDLDQLVTAGAFICQKLGKTTTQSRTANAILAKRLTSG